MSSVDTARERAQSFLHTQLQWVRTFHDRHGDEPWAERDGRADGAVGALRAAGLLDDEDAERWRARLLAPPAEWASAGDAVRERAAALLGELLDAVTPGDDAGVQRFEGALHALAEVGAASGEWDGRLRERLGRPPLEEELARHR